MGLGMGGTMMPIMTSALKTLTHQEVARGSTLLNILQQIAGSVGSATMSVILTNELIKSPVIPGVVDPQSGAPVTEAGLAIAVEQNPALAQQFPVEPGVLERGLEFVANAFSTTFWVGFVLILVTFVPAFFLPRKRQANKLTEEDQDIATPVAMH
jgi:hypothetical protein